MQPFVVHGSNLDLVLDVHLQLKARHAGAGFIYVNFAILDYDDAGGVAIQRPYASVGSFLHGLPRIHDQISYPLCHHFGLINYHLEIEELHLNGDRLSFCFFT